MRNLLLACLVLPLVLAVPGVPDADAAGCTCRHKDGDIPEGQTACIATPKGMMLARCQKVLNNTSWKVLDSPCPTASLRLPGEKAG